MTRQSRHQTDRGRSTDPAAGLPGPGQALIGYPEPQSSLFGVPQSLFGVPLQVARTDERATTRPPPPPRPRNPQATDRYVAPPGRRTWTTRFGFPVAIVVLGVSLGVIVVVMLIAAGVPAPWASAAPARGPAPMPSQATAPEPATYRTTPATRITEDGSYLVGMDVRAGRYVTAGGVTCYWARLRGSGATRTVVAEGNGSDRTVVWIRKADTAFETSGCTVWTRR
jgi:hypothetical protein